MLDANVMLDASVMLDAGWMKIVAIAAPWFAAVLVAVARRQVRGVGFVAALVSVAASALALHATRGSELLGETLMVLFSCLTVVATLVLPRRDCNSRTIAGMLFVFGSTLLAYSTSSLLVLLVAWILTTVPFFLTALFGAATWRPRAGLLLSSVALAAAIGLIAVNGYAMSINRLTGRSPGGMAVFGLLVLAVIFRKGICPAHAWVADAVEGGPAIPTALLLNGHFGAFLVARLIVPLFPHATRDLFPVLSYLALATALYVAIRALAENSPRRLLAFIALSQSACILAGLESRTAEGMTGAFVHWFVVTASTMGLFGILRLLEVRFGENLTASRHLGLAEHAPRLAIFFAIFGLALVGLPGTLSFCSQDLSDSRNAGVAPVDRHAAAHRHCHECRKHFPSIHTPIPREAPNRLRGDGGCLTSRTMDFDRCRVIRGFGRAVSERDCSASPGQFVCG